MRRLEWICECVSNKITPPRRCILLLPIGWRPRCSRLEAIATRVEAAMKLEGTGKSITKLLLKDLPRGVQLGVLHGPLAPAGGAWPVPVVRSWMRSLGSDEGRSLRTGAMKKRLLSLRTSECLQIQALLASLELASLEVSDISRHKGKALWGHIYKRSLSCNVCRI